MMAFSLTLSKKARPSYCRNILAAGRLLLEQWYVFIQGKSLLRRARAYRSTFNACSKAMADVVLDLDFVRVDAEAFAACPDDSIDYAVMENTADAVVVSVTQVGMTLDRGRHYGM